MKINTVLFLIISLSHSNVFCLDVDEDLPCDPPTKTIILVEDIKSIRAVLKRKIAQKLKPHYAAKFLEFDNATIFYEAILQNNSAINEAFLIVLDNHLPNSMKGIELIQKLAEDGWFAPKLKVKFIFNSSEDFSKNDRDFLNRMLLKVLRRKNHLDDLYLAIEMALLS